MNAKKTDRVYGHKVGVILNTALLSGVVSRTMFPWWNTRTTTALMRYLNNTGKLQRITTGTTGLNGRPSTYRLNEHTENHTTT